jgi:hypothetical protein
MLWRSLGTAIQDALVIMLVLSVIRVSRFANLDLIATR